MGADDFVEEGYRTIQEEHGGLEPETKNVLGCAFNAGEHGRPDRSTQKAGALRVG